MTARDNVPSEQEGIYEENQRAIVIPVGDEDLGNFISGLLGQPQSIQKEIYGAFDVDHAWLMNAHHLLYQRIQQQNKASLVAFSAEILFEDGLSRRLTSFEAFQVYVEPKPIISNGVKLKWTYLVQFPNKSTPEKQEVSFLVSTDIRTTSDIEEIFPFRFHRRRGGGVMAYQIDHTERTWGDDIENLFRAHVENTVSKPSSILSYFQSGAMVLAPFVFFASFFLPPIVLSYVSSTKADSLVEELGRLDDSGAETLDLVSNKIDFLISIQEPILESGRYPIVYQLGSLIIGIVTMFVAIWFSELGDKAYVVVTDAARKARDKGVKKSGKNIYIAGGTFVLSIAAGVAANFVYYWLST